MLVNKWNDEDAKKFVNGSGDDPADKELALRVYSSRIIGQDSNLVLHVKGSGWDLGAIEGAGMPGVRMAPLLELRQLNALSDEDMVNIQRSNLLDSTSPNPSVETLLHAFLPHKYVDHTHATAMLSLANLPNVEEVVKEIFGGRLACVPHIMPDFELAKIAARIYDENPDVEGLLLINHGHFAFGDSARQSYDRLIEHTNMVEDWLEKTSGLAPKIASGHSEQMSARAVDILPMLRGIIGDENAAITKSRDIAMPVMDLRNGENVQEFLARDDLSSLSRRGVATPDHVIRTKNYPLYLSADIIAKGHEVIKGEVKKYIADYTAYFEENNACCGGVKTMLMPTPNLAWIEGVGVVGISSNGKVASVASDLAAQNITAITNGEACGGFYPVGPQKLFNMEYWSLEQAKLGKAKPAPMQGRVVMVTGGAGAIGLATAKEFARSGANIFLIDLDDKALATALADLTGSHAGIALDITAKGAADQAMDACVRQLALELGSKGIRVNGVNADRIRSGLLDEAFVSKRAKARGIDEETYMSGNLLGREVKASHVAKAFVALALSERTSAHVMTVDGGNIEAVLR